MAHNLETLANGDTAFFSARVPAWHTLGTVTADCLTAEDALRVAYLGDWNLRKTPLQTVVDSELGAFTVDIEGKFAVVRDNPVTKLPDALGVVGDQYAIISNEDSFAFLNNLVDEGGAHFETAGSLGDGKRVFVTMKMPTHMSVGANGDLTELYLLVTTTHDGTGAFEAAVVPLRVVCQNTLNAGMARAVSHWKIRHTSSAMDRIGEARRALDLTFKYTEQFTALAQELAAAPMRDVDFGKFTSRLIPLAKDATDRQKAANGQTRDNLMWLFREAPTQEPIRGTKWGAFNAVAEYADWGTAVRGDSAVSRATRNMTYQYVTDLKTDALALLSA